jgi:hypothetical protein
MDNLFFPQLLSGALAQYPIRKTRLVRTVKNALADGTGIFYPDPAAARMVWELRYSGLSAVDVQALQAHFAACVGSFRSFTFIDPTENMLVASSDLRAMSWQKDPALSVVAGSDGPEAGNAAFTITNSGQANQGLRQTSTVPTNYQYCLSAYCRSAQPTMVTLSRRGTVATDVTTCAISTEWTRVVSSGRLNDPSNGLTVEMIFPAGQQVQVYGLQLEAQIAPSRYRPTGSRGGVYVNAHWGVDELVVMAEALNLYSTAFTVEAAA